MAMRGFVVALMGTGLALGAAVWAAKPPRTGKVGETAIGDKTPTFYKDVLPIAQEHCQTCHRPGQIGPFSLLDYQSARPWAKAIKSAVVARKMPPWLANPEYGHFTNDRSLSQAEIGTLVAWAENGAPAGEPTDAPPAVQWPEGGWSVKPDLTVDLPPFPVPATGVLDWERLAIPAPFKEDTWVTSVEILPGAPAVVHHMCFQFEKHKPTTPYNLYEWVEIPRDDTGLAKIHDGKSQATEGTVVSRAVGSTWSEVTRRAGKPIFTGGVAEFCYLPGGGPQDYRPLQAGILVPAGSDIDINLHYTTNGATATDRTRIGFTIAKVPPAKKIVNQSGGNEGDNPAEAERQDVSKIAIPPYDGNYLAPPLEYTFKKDTDLLWAQPHAHVRGKSVRYTLIYPDGRQEIILDVPHYDFNWQMTYRMSLKIPKGSRMRVQFAYDNSPSNRYNPDPSKWVYYGAQSWEEMGSAFLGFLMDRNENENDVLQERAVN